MSAIINSPEPTKPTKPKNSNFMPGTRREGRELVKCGPYLVPVPRVTTLGDTIEEAMSAKPEGWKEWLERYQLWDEGMSEKEAFTRYYKFHKVKFLAVP